MRRISVLIITFIISISIVFIVHAFDYANNSSNIDITETQANEINSDEVVIPETYPTVEENESKQEEVDDLTDKFISETDKGKNNSDNEDDKLNNKNHYTDEDVDVLSRLIFGEAGGHSWELKLGVGSVVLNRVKDKRYPDNIKDVVFDKKFGLQYSCTRKGGNYWKTPNKESIDAAIYLLENGSQFPDYVIFQAQFKQGNKVYEKIQNTYFCYWSKDVK